MRRLPILLVALLPFFSFSQSEYFKDFGSPLLEEIQLKDCSFDPGAAAVYLRKDATTVPNYHGSIVYYRYRLKILKNSAIDLANIKIRVYSFYGYETIEDIKAVSINYDEQGNRKESVVDAKNIYVTKDDDYYSTISFSMPNVREGTIIEYRYTSLRRSYKIIDLWYFQDEIPVVASVFDYTVQPNSEFAYRVIKQGDIPVNLKEDKHAGKFVFEIKNLPGIKDEPYMDSKKDYMVKVELQMNASGMLGDRERFVGTWPELSRELLRDEEFGKQLDHGIPGTNDLIHQARPIVNEKQRISFIFNEVQRHMSWDHYVGVYAKNKLKFAWEKRRGTASEINLILIRVLESSGIAASPLLVSDRFHGKVNTSHPFISQFSKVIAYVETGHHTYFLDASLKENIVSLIPESLLNTTGYLVDRKNPRFVSVSDPQHYDKKVVNITGTIDLSGQMKGQAYIMDKDYLRAEKEAQLRSDRNQFIHANFEEPVNRMRVDSMQIENLDNDTLPLNQLVNFTHQLENSGDYLLMQLNLFNGMEKNPFISDKRYTAINFGRNRSITMTESFSIPEEITPEELPKDIFLRMPDTSISVRRNMSLSTDGKRINMRLKLEMNRSYFEAEEYASLKDFFKKLYDILDEPVVLKKRTSQP